MYIYIHIYIYIYKDKTPVDSSAVPFFALFCPSLPFICLYLPLPFAFICPFLGSYSLIFKVILIMIKFALFCLIFALFCPFLPLFALFPLLRPYLPLFAPPICLYLPTHLPFFALFGFPDIVVTCDYETDR